MLHMTLEEHDADPPENWTVKKHGRKWALCNKHGHPLEYTLTKKEAEALKTKSDHVSLYIREGEWFKGVTRPGYKSYAQCLAENKQLVENQAKRGCSFSVRHVLDTGKTFVGHNEVHVHGHTSPSLVNGIFAVAGIQYQINALLHADPGYADYEASPKHQLQQV